MILPNWFSNTLIFFGLLASLFYGWKACDAFEVDAKGKTWGWRVHQFWFNFAGSLLGWIGAWFLARKGWQCVTLASPADLNWSDAGLIVATFVGVTGHLPYAVAGVLQGIKELAQKLTGLVK